MLQAVLLALWAGLCMWDQYGPHLGFRKPLLASVGVGIILGNLPLAIMIGATLELTWLGVNNIGAYVPPDVITGTVVGASLGILSGAETSEAIALAVAIGVPTATLVQQLHILVMTTNITWLHRADHAAETGDFKKINKWFWLGGISFFLTRAIPVFVAVGIGSFVIEGIMNFLTTQIPWVLKGFSLAGGMMPAVGLAMLLSLMMKKNMWIFLVAGFVAAAYLKIPTMGIALAAVVAAGIYDLIINPQAGVIGVAQAGNAGGASVTAASSSAQSSTSTTAADSSTSANNEDEEWDL